MRADIVYRDGTRSVLIDVTIANPAGRSYQRLNPSEVDDAVAKEREERKAHHYDRVRADYHIVPFVIEATGRLGPAARQWIKEVIADPAKRAAFREQIGTKVMQLNTAQLLQLKVNIASTTSSNLNSGNRRLENPGSD